MNLTLNTRVFSRSQLWLITQRSHTLTSTLIAKLKNIKRHNDNSPVFVEFAAFELELRTIAFAVEPHGDVEAEHHHEHIGEGFLLQRVVAVLLWHHIASVVLVVLRKLVVELHIAVEAVASVDFGSRLVGAFLVASVEFGNRQVVAFLVACRDMELHIVVEAVLQHRKAQLECKDCSRFLQMVVVAETIDVDTIIKFSRYTNEKNYPTIKIHRLVFHIVCDI
jgi:hypothetical protein